MSDRNYNELHKKLIENGFDINQLVTPKIIEIPGCMPLKCFSNVVSYVKKNNSWKICNGWSIVKSDHNSKKCDVFSFEYHSVLCRKSDNLLVDITPDIENLTDKLFIPDHVLTYDKFEALFKFNPCLITFEKVGKCKYCKKHNSTLSTKHTGVELISRKKAIDLVNKFNFVYL